MSGDAEWLAWRKAGLGASDVAAAYAGVYDKTAMSVVAEKLGLIDTTPTAAQQAIFDRGHALEPMVTTATEALTGWHIVGEQTWCQHPEFPHHRATVDGFLATEPETSIDDVVGLFECKTRGVGRPQHLDYYEAQVSWQMWVTGLDVALLTEATVTEGGDIIGTRSWSFERDEALIAKLVALADEMWSWIQRGEVPPPTHPDDLAVVTAMTRTADAVRDTVDLTDMADDVAEAAAVRAEIKALEERKALVDARIKHAIGAATRAIAPGWAVSYSVPRRELDDAAVLAAYPELARQAVDRDKAAVLGVDLDPYKRQIGARRLTITPTKDHQ